MRKGWGEMQDELDFSLGFRLRGMARAGASVSQMLRAAMQHLDLKPHHSKILLIHAMRDAFGIRLSEASAIGGWSADGTGELSDERIDEFVMPAIVSCREEWDR